MEPKKLDWQLWAKLFEGPSKRDPKTSIPTLGRKNGRPQVNGTKKNLTGNYGPKCLETRVKGMKNNSQLWGKNPNYGPKNDSLASLLSSLFSFLFPFFVLFLFSTLLFSLHCVFVSFLFILAPVSFLLCFFSLLSSLFFFSL